ncbi:MAG: hypothetical protein IIA54_00460 [Chloroflexi bacterium]|nr:hypothetical protein [Chloroflexota bacterium]
MEPTAKRIALLTAIEPPRQGTTPVSIVQGGRTSLFGPFGQRTLIRIVASAGDIWYAFGDQGVRAVSRVTGVGLAAGTWVDYQIPEGKGLFVHLINDVDSPVAFGNVFPTGQAPACE